MKKNDRRSRILVVIMDTMLFILAAVFLLAGLAGTVVPFLPGVPLAWLGLLSGYFCSYCRISVPVLAVTAFFAAAVSTADNILPVLFTKKYSGSRASVRGSAIGLIAGFFAGPLGLVLGPLFGAFIGELVHNHEDVKKAASVAWGSFLGFLFGTGAKIIVCSAFIWIFIISLIIRFSGNSAA